MGRFLGFLCRQAVVRSLDQPDETRSFPNGAAEMVTIADTMIGRARFEAGWRWSNDVKPIAGTDWCMVLHEGYCVSGSAIVRAEDGQVLGHRIPGRRISVGLVVKGSSAIAPA
jgi:hypothetical protein